MTRDGGLIPYVERRGGPSVETGANISVMMHCRGRKLTRGVEHHRRCTRECPCKELCNQPRRL